VVFFDLDVRVLSESCLCVLYGGGVVCGFGGLLCSGSSCYWLG